MRIRNHFNDFFYKRTDKSKVHLKYNLKLVVIMTAINEKEFQFNFFKANDSKLTELDFTFTLQLTRTQISDESLFKEGCREKAKELKMLKEQFGKNQKKNIIGETVGRVYLKKQDFSNLRIKKIKKRGQ